jgi:protein O-mannosyl-transferase
MTSKKSQPKRSRAEAKSSATEALPSTEFLTEGRALLMIVVGTLLVYANSLGGEFVFDDVKQIIGNQALHSWGNLFRAFTTDVWDFQRGTYTADIPPPYYRPLFTAYLTIGYQLFGLWEPGWHLMNTAVHLGASVAVYYLLRRLSRDRVVALLGALVFGLHPAHVESVSWISGIPDPLAALFYIPALAYYVRYREDGGKRWLIVSIIAYALSTLCKETVLVLPAVIFVWEMTRETKAGWQARLRGAVPMLIPYAVVALSYLALRFAVLGRLTWKHPMMARVPDSEIWMTVPYVLVSYLRHLVAPFQLSLIYGTSFVARAASLQFVLPVVLLVALAGLLWVYRRRITSEMWVALALLFAPLVPVLNLKVFHHEYIIQDRYLYLPSIGFCYLVALLIVRLAARSRMIPAMALAGAILISFGASTILQNRVWHDAVALWQRALAYAPHYWSAHYNLGLAYLERKDYESARRELLEAARIDPGVALIYNNLALAQTNLGDTNGAIESLKQALSINPQLAEARNNLGTALFARGDYAAARSEFAQSLERDPTSLSARFNLARTMAAMNDHASAIREYEAVLARQPTDAGALYQLALSYAATGRKQEAVARIERALGLVRDASQADEMRRALERIQRTGQLSVVRCFANDT